MPAGPAFSLEQTGGSQAAGGSAKTKAVASVDALLALQSVPDATTGRARAVKRGENMLDVLDNIKIDLLAGAVPQSHLNRLLSIVNANREQDLEPELVQILDEIELRARVELAKFGHIAA